MGITVVTRNHQVTLPSDIREQSDIEVGDKIIVSLNEEGEILMKKLGKSPVDRAFGMLKMEETGLEYERKLRNEWKGR